MTFTKHHLLATCINFGRCTNPWNQVFVRCCYWEIKFVKTLYQARPQLAQMVERWLPYPVRRGSNPINFYCPRPRMRDRCGERGPLFWKQRRRNWTWDTGIESLGQTTGLHFYVPHFTFGNFLKSDRVRTKSFRRGWQLIVWEAIFRLLQRQRLNATLL